MRSNQRHDERETAPLTLSYVRRRALNSFFRRFEKSRVILRETVVGSIEDFFNLVQMTTFTRIHEDESPTISVDVSRRLSKIGEFACYN